MVHNPLVPPWYPLVPPWYPLVPPWYPLDPKSEGLPKTCKNEQNSILKRYKEYLKNHSKIKGTKVILQSNCLFI